MLDIEYTFRLGSETVCKGWSQVPLDSEPVEYIKLRLDRLFATQSPNNINIIQVDKVQPI